MARLVNLQPHQQRVVDEGHALGEKIIALQAFIAGNPMFVTLPHAEQDRMRDQLVFMQAYYGILVQRVCWFKL